MHTDSTRRVFFRLNEHCMEMEISTLHLNTISGALIFMLFGMGCYLMTAVMLSLPLLMGH